MLAVQPSSTPQEHTITRPLTWTCSSRRAQRRCARVVRARTRGGFTRRACSLAARRATRPCQGAQRPRVVLHEEEALLAGAQPAALSDALCPSLGYLAGALPGLDLRRHPPILTALSLGVPRLSTTTRCSSGSTRRTRRPSGLAALRTTSSAARTRPSLVSDATMKRSANLSEFCWPLPIDPADYSRVLELDPDSFNAAYARAGESRRARL